MSRLLVGTAVLVCAFASLAFGDAVQDEFINILVSQSPWHGSWGGYSAGALRGEPIGGKMDLVFKRDDGRLSAEIMNATGSRMSPVSDLKVEGQTVTFKSSLGGHYLLKYKEEGLRGTATSIWGAQMAVDLNPTKK